MMLNFQRFLQSSEIRVFLLGGSISSFKTQYLFLLAVDHEHCH